MSSFFTAPASQRKRKRTEPPIPAAKKQNVASSTSSTKAPRRTERDDSISGSGSSDDEGNEFFESAEQDGSGSSEDEIETAAEKRLRLAERYLDNIRNEVEEDVGFDAEQIDRDLIAERLKEDVAETKGKIYRRIANTLDFVSADYVFGKSDRQHSVTGCAALLPHVWTISKDLMVSKWELFDPETYNAPDTERPTNFFPRRRPKRLFWRKGNKNKAKDRDYLGHTAAIISVAISDSGKFLATGDENARLIIWDADTLTPRKLFTQHRAAITSLSFRRGTEQLFSASADRTIKIWSCPELAYIETLFGHQDSVIGIAGGLDTNQETCVSVGARDRTARLWKVVEESQLVFRGGGSAKQKGMDKLRKGRFGGNISHEGDRPKSQANDVHNHDDDPPIAYAEGSIDCVALLDTGLFVTGSDNGALSLWAINKKKPLFTLPLAHGRDPPLAPDELSADVHAIEKGVKGPRLPRYITALTTVPFADLILSASWDGWIRAWRVGSEKRSIEELGKVGRVAVDGERLVNGNGVNGLHETADSILVRGIVNGLSVCERGDRGKAGLCIVAAVGKEPRLGRWMEGKGRTGIAVFEVPKKSTTNEAESSGDVDEAE
ncbi:small nucleolar ribonucleoprotein complex subunit [Lindgomyces ingoldianus]|uniref:Small nucleolar ribonucleoprotein complex subunit n=1 Tax=Lindgomyces ingoldianus TaxID=673940 RepID=A0ACB6R7I2_9PLEO|nr:small nucleolar ribonucleoprotein complex subunit [Lindgomyces ingoldianus]KAF2474758.1 small nucleolar ribonucleoprotein complex subunit [Lindgomyces ingoldianus]